MRRWLTILGAAAALFAAAFLGSPYWTVWRLSQAIKAGDAREVTALTDFPAVRANLKPQLDGWLRARAAKDAGKHRGWLASLELMLAPQLLGSAVDMVVTPENLTAMLRSGRPPDVAKPAPPPEALSSPTVAEGPREPARTRAVRLGYEGGDLDLFHADIVNRAHPDRSVTVKLVRRGVLRWRVESVVLPPSVLRP